MNKQLSAINSITKFTLNCFVKKVFHSSNYQTYLALIRIANQAVLLPETIKDFIELEEYSSDSEISLKKENIKGKERSPTSIYLFLDEEKKEKLITLLKLDESRNSIWYSEIKENIKSQIIKIKTDLNIDLLDDTQINIEDQLLSILKNIELTDETIRNFPLEFLFHDTETCLVDKSNNQIKKKLKKILSYIDIDTPNDFKNLFIETIYEEVIKINKFINDIKKCIDSATKVEQEKYCDIIELNKLLRIKSGKKIQQNILELTLNLKNTKPQIESLLRRLSPTNHLAIDTTTPTPAHINLANFFQEIQTIIKDKKTTIINQLKSPLTDLLNKEKWYSKTNYQERNINLHKIIEILESNDIGIDKTNVNLTKLKSEKNETLASTAVSSISEFFDNHNKDVKHAEIVINIISELDIRKLIKFEEEFEKILAKTPPPHTAHKPLESNRALIDSDVDDKTPRVIKEQPNSNDSLDLSHPKQSRLNLIHPKQSNLVSPEKFKDPPTDPCQPPVDEYTELAPAYELEKTDKKEKKRILNNLINLGKVTIFEKNKFKNLLDLHNLLTTTTKHLLTIELDLNKITKKEKKSNIQKPFLNELFLENLLDNCKFKEKEEITPSLLTEYPIKTIFLERIKCFISQKITLYKKNNINLCKYLEDSIKNKLPFQNIFQNIDKKLLTDIPLTFLLETTLIDDLYNELYKTKPEIKDELSKIKKHNKQFFINSLLNFEFDLKDTASQDQINTLFNENFPQETLNLFEIINQNIFSSLSTYQLFNLTNKLFKTDIDSAQKQSPANPIKKKKQKKPSDLTPQNTQDHQLIQNYEQNKLKEFETQISNLECVVIPKLKTSTELIGYNLFNLNPHDTNKKKEKINQFKLLFEQIMTTEQKISKTYFKILINTYINKLNQDTRNIIESIYKLQDLIIIYSQKNPAPLLLAELNLLETDYICLNEKFKFNKTPPEISGKTPVIEVIKMLIIEEKILNLNLFISYRSEAFTAIEKKHSIKLITQHSINQSIHTNLYLNQTNTATTKSSSNLTTPTISSTNKTSNKFDKNKTPFTKQTPQINDSSPLLKPTQSAKNKEITKSNTPQSKKTSTNYHIYPQETHEINTPQIARKLEREFNQNLEKQLEFTEIDATEKQYTIIKDKALSHKQDTQEIKEAIKNFEEIMDIMLFEHPPFNSKHFFVKLLNRMLFFAKIYDNTILEAFILISPFIDYYMEKKYKDCSNQILFKEIYLTEDDYINLNETLLQNGQSTKVTIDTCLYKFSNSYA